MSQNFIRQFNNATSTHANTSRAARDYPVKVLGIRGYYNVGAPGNDLGLYDDLIVICVNNDTESFRASTDPGRYMIRNPMNSRGCAVLSEAVHYFKKGSHDSRDAFVQAEPVKVYRLDKDGNVQGSSWLNSSLNMHSGAGLGAGGQGDDVGQMSAGCQIIFNPPGYFQGGANDPWFKFYRRLSDAMAAHAQTVFPYKLVAAADMI